MVITHVLSLAMVLSVLSMRMSQAEDQPPSGPPDMLVLYLTRIDAQSMSLLESFLNRKEPNSTAQHRHQ